MRILNLRNITCPKLYLEIIGQKSIGRKLQKSNPSLLRKKVALAQVTENPRDSDIA